MKSYLFWTLTLSTCFSQLYAEGFRCTNELIVGVFSSNGEETKIQNKVFFLNREKQQLAIYEKTNEKIMLIATFYPWNGIHYSKENLKGPLYSVKIYTDSEKWFEVLSVNRKTGAVKNIYCDFYN